MGRGCLEVMRSQGIGAGALWSRRFRFPRPCPWRFARATVAIVHEQPHDDSGHLFDRQHVVDSAAAHRIQRHRRGLRFIGILNHRHAPRLFNQSQPMGAVGHMAGQDDADRAGAVVLGRCSKERIDGWAETVLARAVGKTDVAAVDNQVIIRWCDIDTVHRVVTMPSSGVTTVNWVARLRTLRQPAGTVRRRVDHDEDCGRDVLREFVQKRTDRADSAGRRSDDDDVSRRHVECSHVTTQDTTTAKQKIRDRFRTEERCSCPRRSSQLR